MALLAVAVAGLAARPRGLRLPFAARKRRGLPLAGALRFVEGLAQLPMLGFELNHAAL
jgi:hypothetical protein